MRMPIPLAPISRATVERLNRVFHRKALRPEIYRARCWIAFTKDGRRIVVPEPFLIWENAFIFADFPLGMANPNDTANPSNGRIQIAMDLLEKFTKTVVTMAEVTEFRWVGRCSAWWQNFTDETDWHEAASEEALAQELIDVYGEPQDEDEARPQMRAN